MKILSIFIILAVFLMIFLSGCTSIETSKDSAVCTLGGDCDASLINKPNPSEIQVSEDTSDIKRNI